MTMPPRLFPRLRSFVAALWHRRALERAMDEEFALHLELRTDDLIQQGMPRDEAERRARLEFGNVTATKEVARASWGTAWVESLRQDLHYALRTLRKTPGFTLVAVLSLGFGIGATTTVFSVIDALDFRPLPFTDAARLVWLAEVTPPDDAMCSRCAWLTASPTARDWAEHARAFGAVAAVGSIGFSWQHDDVSESLSARAATPGFFRLLGVRPLLGRGFVAGDTITGAAPVVLLSYELWRTRFGGDPNVVGTQLLARYGGGLSPALRSITVVGVLPRDFQFRYDTPLWLPMGLSATSSRASRWLTVIGRLRHGETIAAANAELETIAARLAGAYPAAYRGWGASVQPLRTLLTTGAGTSRFVLFAITTLVLCIAVLNVTGLLLGRAAARQREFAMRSALGASRTRLMQQLLVEGSCVGLGGGTLGTLVAMWSVRFVPLWFSTESSGLTVGVDHRMLLFAVTISVVVGIGAAVAPALRAASIEATSTLRARTAGAGAHATRTSNALIAVQIALALVLLTAAGLLSQDFLELRYLDIGYNPHGLYSTSIVGTREQSANPAAWGAMADAARARVASIPGVVSASLEHQSAIHPQIVRPDGGDAFAGSSITPVVKAVNPGYFTTFGTRLLSGRTFSNGDRRGAPLVAIVNRTTADRFWPGQNPLGKRIVLGDSGSVADVLTVVGVAADAERGELFERHWPMVYRPFQQATIYHAVAALYVRVADNGPDALAAAQAAIRQVTGRPAAPMASEEARLGTRFYDSRANAIALDLFGGFGLLLAAMGIYGSITYAVTQRTREIGIRMALGAERWSVVRLVARRGVLLALGGVCAGTAGALVLTRVLGSMLVTTNAASPWIFGGAALLVIGIALIATFLPARHATRVDAVIALRAE
jgi:putative ABC transport system permease protein